MTDVQTEKVEAAARALGAGPARLLACGLDVTSSAEVDACVAAAVAHCGRIDILVNCAGGSGRTPVDDIDEVTDALWDEVVDSNLKGTFLCCRAAMPHLRRSGHGSIISFASGAVLGVEGSSTLTTTAVRHAYAAAKAGLIGLGNQLAKDLATAGVAVNVVMPGFVMTEPGARVRDLFDEKTEGAQKAMLDRLGVPPRTPEQVGWAVTYLVSDRGRGHSGVVMRLTGKITSADLVVVPDANAALGRSARLQPG
jgi:meso-butanediol dehydrogenase/(S,S)-butanediol dehydrogenase/diacetyl reductase